MIIMEFTKTIAKEAGDIIRRGYESKRHISHKAGRELVTDIDIAAEKHLRARINEQYPDHEILAEEFGGKLETDSYLWIIDPLDGTNNFAHGFPFFCTSIALAKGGKIILGAVYDPLRDELFRTDNTGDGRTYLNDNPIAVAEAEEISEALVATGFPYDIDCDGENNIENFQRVCINARGIRRAGSAALDLCYVACGRLDGFWEMKLKPWDMAAGVAIVENAGGICSDYFGEKWQLESDRIITANPTLQPKLAKLIR